MLLEGKAAIRLGYCSDGERALRGVLERDAGSLDAHRNLMHLYKMEGRFHELRPHALALLRAGDSGNEFLMPLAAPDELTLGQNEFQQAEACRRAVPGDALPMLGLARHLVQNAEFERAIGMLQKIAAGSPPNNEALALLGTAIQHTGDENAFVRWLNGLPETADTHPEIWFLRGAAARLSGKPRVAIRCFWETVRRDPNHLRGHFQLGRLLATEEQPKAARAFAARFEKLEEVSRLATRGDDASQSKMTATTMDRIATTMEQLGRLWEAAAWYRKALELDSQSPQIRDRLEAVFARLNDATPLTLADSNLAKRFDLTTFPLPAKKTPGEQRPGQSASPAGDAAIAFNDVAGPVGLSFRFQNGADARAGIARMYEFSGGGVAVVDFDGDGWPDLYLTQGSDWPLGSGGHRDRLFRNVNGERFEDVTEQSGMGDERYSQGAAVGDFNNDGFPDIYLANIGQNRLYQNNGDGTFTDIGDAIGIDGDEWTASCLLADVNGDGLPDVYCVNYLGGDDVFTRKCLNRRLPIQCPLHYFPSAQDRLYLNRGDGRFADVTGTSGIAVPEGKGMGIVAANLRGRRRLDLFVANDDKPNFLFVDSSNDVAGPPKYQNRGVVSGLAFGDDGTAQSCMGIAAGDVNNDGLLDFLVTNYTNEHNNLYLQRSPGVFEDAARSAGLHQPTYALMGWGTQFIDADLDGLLDLVVANGHLDRNTAGQLPHQMPTQVFRNLGRARFRELSANSLGAYFKKHSVGRAVARVDWNRDGADDVCVTHVDAPVALLSNASQRRGRFLCLHLRASPVVATPSALSLEYRQESVPGFAICVPGTVFKPATNANSASDWAARRRSTT